MKSSFVKKIATIASAIIVSALFIPSAQAADKGYRYWGYFQSAPGQNAWTMAQTGPTVPIADGDVEGWAFTFSSDKIPDAAAPRVAPNFAKICSGIKTPAAGKKRIGLVIDFGSAFLRPKGESIPRQITKCVVVDKAALGSDVVYAVTKIRASASGFFCGLNGYPAKECGVEIPTPASLLSNQSSKK
ncbi:unannotated protein [freshwater metagenome]|uniref:Unannotated protein n=1 Tax=freshwater metagenome TaxID=449393 RepID=A0A6J6LBK3_9ZZZZ